MLKRKINEHIQKRLVHKKLQNLCRMSFMTELTGDETSKLRHDMSKLSNGDLFCQLDKILSLVKIMQFSHCLHLLLPDISHSIL